jgi:hypothetical protein
MKNAAVKRITIQQALSGAAFRDGFSDYSNRKGWNEKPGRADQWNYERGRMLAAWLETKGVNPASYPLKRGRWATRAAMDAYRSALREGSIF